MAMPATILAYSGLELIGDGFMKLPFLRAIRGTWPEARVTWLAGKGRTVFAGTLAPLAAPYLDEVIEDAAIGSRARELLGRPLAGRRFDLVLDTQRRVLTTLILRRIRHGVFVSSAVNFHLSDRRPEGRSRKPPAMAAQLLDLLRVAAGRAPRLAPPPVLPDSFRAAAALALPQGAPLLGLVPGAGGRQKCWPLERYIALARQAPGWGARAVWLLGPEERDWTAELRAATPDALFPLQDERLDAALAGAPLFTLALAGRLRLAVSNDCGTAHILAAADCPMVSLFGPSAAAKFAPSTPDLAVIRAQDFGGEAMALIPFDAVSAAVDARLDRNGRVG
jgi:ADP-heptose:LPS heptosyltransferase